MDTNGIRFAAALRQYRLPGRAPTQIETHFRQRQLPWRQLEDVARTPRPLLHRSFRLLLQ